MALALASSEVTRNVANLHHSPGVITWANIMTTERLDLKGILQKRTQESTNAE